MSGQEARPTAALAGEFPSGDLAPVDQPSPNRGEIVIQHAAGDQAVDPIERALHKIAPKNGDIVFVDARLIDPIQLCAIHAPAGAERVVFFAVQLLDPQLSLCDLTRVVGIRQLKEAIRAIEADA